VLFDEIFARDAPVERGIDLMRHSEKFRDSTARGALWHSGAAFHTRARSGGVERMTPTPGPFPVPRTTPEGERETQPGHDSALTALPNYLIVSGMLACAAIGAVQLGLQLSPTWNAWHVPLLCFFISLESAYLTRFVRHGKLPVPWYVLRGVEVVVLFLMLRSLLGVLRGPPAAPDVYAGEIDRELLALAIIALLTWLPLAHHLRLLTWKRLSYAAREVIHEAARAQAESRRVSSRSRRGSAALTFLAGLLRVHLRSNNQIEPPVLYGCGTCIYFFLALVLFSRTRLKLLRSGWM
jgi:hypothetical protein